MDGGQSMKGTVTSLSSMFSPEEAQGAARRVEEAITDRKIELDRVRSFVEDNLGLVKLVQRLPDQLHHDIMVPFGKGAFLPGRLIHTNEFLVLLGEGYYVDRTSKQTVEILNRRGEVLESQVERLKAMIKDLKAEASFFYDTSTEAAEGLVEIREEYVEEHSTEEVKFKASTQVDSTVLFDNENVKSSAREEEFARILSRMEELEIAELAAEDETENNDDKRLLFRNEMEKAAEDEFLTGHSSDTVDDDDMEGNEFDELEIMKSCSSQSQPRKPVFNDLRTSKRFQCEKTASELFQRGGQNPLDKLELKGSITKPVPRGEILIHKDFAHDGETSSIKKAFEVAKVNENLHRERSLGKLTPAESLQTAFDSEKAFTGSIVERPYNLNQAGTSAQSASSLPSKPVSRFKMQRK